MPALRLFNRRTLLAGDDLQLPTLAWGSVAAAQLFLFVTPLLFRATELLLTSDDDGWDDDGDPMRSAACYDATSGYTDLLFPRLVLVYLIATAAYAAVSLRYEQRIFQLSSLGTPTMRQELRAPLGGLIEFKMTYLAGCNLLLLACGIALASARAGDFWGCFPTLWWVAWIALFFTQAAQCLLVFTTLVSLWRVRPATASPEGDSDFYRRHVDTAHSHGNSQIAEEMWQTRCEGCCRTLAVSTCFMFGGRGIVSRAAEGEGEKFYGDIARALADYFADFGDGSEEGGAGLDVVPSDVGLGFAMLRHTQAQKRMLAKRDALQQMRRLEGSRSGSVGNLQSVGTGSDGAPLSPNRTTLLFRRSSQSRIETMKGSVVNDLDGASSNVNPPREPADSEAEGTYASFSRTVLSPTNPDDVALLEEGARFARHQLAIYTWMLYYYQFPMTGTFRLVGRALKGRLKRCVNGSASQTDAQRLPRGNNYETCPAAPDVEVGVSDNNVLDETNRETFVGDNFLRVHEATLLAHAGLERSDVAYASFEAGFYETPYCIVVDRKWRSVVLSIRGSLTLEDCVVDVLLDPSPLDDLGGRYGFDGAGQHCHGGVVECANWLHEDLQRHKVLQRLLRGENAEYPDYTLRIVGHSIGAGIGVLLSLMLRNTYPNLRCLAYSPPGGLLTWELATKCSEFVNSFVLDSDIVPRLSVNNMERLRDDVLHLIARVRLPKYEIAQRIFWHGVCGEDPGDLDFLVQQNDDMLYPPDAVPPSDFARALGRFEATQAERRSNRGLARSVNLYPPGRITHLARTGQSRACLHGLAGCATCGASNAGAEYTPIRKENDDFNEIEVSPTLWTDHFPNRVCAEIERVAERFGIDTALGSPPDC